VAREIRRRSGDEERLLTAREDQVLRMTADGMSAPDIARELHLGATTVKTHLQRVYEKLGVSDRAAAVAEAMRRGILD
jgi:two-component system nitrate/nitrite response regulator NarL